MARKQAGAAYCLDTGCILDWLKQSQEHPQHVEAMDALLAEVRGGQCKLIIPAAVVAELLPGRDERLPRFIGILRGSGNLPISVRALDFSIAVMTAQLRADLDIPGNRRTVDAMILATAIHAKAKLLYSTDDDLIRLDGRLSTMERNRPAEGFQILHIKNHLRGRLPLGL